MKKYVDLKRGTGDVDFMILSDIVEDINNHWFDVQDGNDNWSYPLEIRSTGAMHCVLFMGTYVWGTEDDFRPYDEEKDEYGSLETFLIKECKTILEHLSKFKEFF